MEQNPTDQNKNEGWFPKNQIYTIVGVIIVLAAIIFFVTRGGENQNNDNQANDQQDEQVAGDNNTNQDNDEDQDSGTPTSDDSVSGSGDVTATGTLRASDNPARGNLMIDSNRGKIYISTKRDFSSLIGSQVTLQAEGTLNQFRFLGFANTGADVGGAPDQDQAPTTPANSVTFRGKLDKSSSVKGNYTITSGNTVVYFKTVRDYSAWVGSDVTLHASGTLNSFTNGRLVK